MTDEKQTKGVDNTSSPLHTDTAQSPLPLSPVSLDSVVIKVPSSSDAFLPAPVKDDDCESANSYANFSEIRVRHRFVKKVYSIVSLQLLITTVFIAIFRFYPPLANYCAAFEGQWILYTCIVGTLNLIFILSLSFSCVESVRRHYPSNLILLLVFTVLESILLGFITSLYSTSVLLIAIGLTGIIVIGLTIFAFQTKYDFTGFGKLFFCII